MKQVVIVGGGPAGLSASLYTARAGLPTLLVARDGGALERAEQIENYFGFPEPITGEALLARGRAGASRLGVRLLDAEVTGLRYDGRFHIESTAGALDADGVILATGAERALPPLPGASEFLGRGISFCAVCDAFACRGRAVAVLGSGAYALAEAEALAPLAASVTLFTDGAPPPPDCRYPTVTERLAAIEGDTRVRGLRTASGALFDVDMVFFALGVAGSTALAATLGVEVEGGRVKVDGTGATDLPGLYAAGDCIGGLLQVSTAVAEGARAALALIAYLKKS